MVKEFIKNAKFDEMYASEAHETVTYYFYTTTDALDWYLPNADYPEATKCAISVEFNNRLGFDPMYADVMISPVMEDDEGWTEDYDYTYVDMEQEDIIYLINNFIKLDD